MNTSDNTTELENTNTNMNITDENSISITDLNTDLNNNDSNNLNEYLVGGTSITEDYLNTDSMKDNNNEDYSIKLEEKNNYIKELENVIKYQQEEIETLKQKLESQEKLDYLIKIKNNLEEKDNMLKKETKVYTEPEFNDYKMPNENLNLSASAQTKRLNRISIKEDSNDTPRYSGVSILEQTKEEPTKIVVDYNNIDENSEKIIKQRRRRTRF